MRDISLRTFAKNTAVFSSNRDGSDKGVIINYELIIEVSFNSSI